MSKMKRTWTRSRTC